MSADRPLLGLMLMVGFCLAAPLADAVAKIVGASVPLGMVVAARFVVQAAVLWPLAVALRLSLGVPPGLWGLVLARTALHVAGITLMFLSLRYLPLADAIAIAYVMPFVVLLIGALAMGETVGARRVAACVVGFGGTLLVIQPAFRDVGAAALLPLGVALIFAVFMLLTRRIAREIAPLELQAVNGLIGSAMVAPVLLLGLFLGWPEARFAPPTATETGLLLAVGLLGTVAHLLLTASLRFAPASTLAPIQYLEIPFAVVIGFVLFGDFPTGAALAGIGIVVAAGLYVIVREQRAATRLRHALPPAPHAGPPAAE